MAAPHTCGMHQSMRATVTIRDDLFERADRAAAELGVSRSRLYQTALETYLRRLEEDALTVQMNSVASHLDQAREGSLRKYVARTWKQSMGDDEW